jgi:uncharacterized protein (PEP-CTERM system associated)
MAMAFAGSAHALDWRLEPSVSASATYTDNANQSENNPEEALILTVTPGFALHSEGSRRVKATLQYGLTGVMRIGEDESTDVNHRLNAVGNAELVEDFLFIDGSASISQELISLFGSPAEAEINDTNRATVGTYSISPYIRKRLGSFANAQARYTNSGAIFQNDAAADSSSNSFTASLASGPRFGDLNWGLDYSIRKTENRDADTADANADITYERASATVGYALTRKFRVFGTVGEEWNDYLSASDTDGSSWSVGFGWAPTRRTSIEASAGERYFGNTYSFSGSHRTRSSRWTVRYSEDVSDISQLNVNFNDLQGGVVICPIGTVLPPSPTLIQALNAGCAVNLFFGTSITNGVYISKLLTAGVSWDVASKTTVSMTLSDLTREYQLGNQGEDRVQAATGSISYRLSPQTTASSSLSLTRNSADAATIGTTARDDDIWRLSFGLNHQFAADLSGALLFSHIQRDSNAANSDYEENRLTASVNMRF